MRYGYFDDKNREYVITRPDTPFPWINYLGCEEYFGLISNTAGGYSFFRDARLRRLTRYRYNNAPLDNGGRYIYLRDQKAAIFGHPPGSPPGVAGQVHAAGTGWDIPSLNLPTDIETSTCYFVPLGENLEVWRRRLPTSAANGRLSVFSSIEFCLWDA